MNADLKKRLLDAQRNEITEHQVYRDLARSSKDAASRRVLTRIAGDEKRHYGILKGYTRVDVPPRRPVAFFYYWISRLLGLTFGVKLMELGEKAAQGNYRTISRAIPRMKKVARDEDRHERMILGMLDEEYLQYVSSIVLGINDALVELTGAMAGLTFALRNNKLVALAGIITGVAASLSMAASEYLSKRHEGGAQGSPGQSPLKASVYTGIAYLLTVAFLVFPYLVLPNPFLSLVWMMANALLVILAFTSYISVAKEQPFKSRFLEMAGLSTGVALLSFFIGLLARHLLGVDVG